MPLMIYCPGSTSVAFYFSHHDACSPRLPRLTAVLTRAILMTAPFSVESERSKKEGERPGEKNVSPVFFIGFSRMKNRTLTSIYICRDVQVFRDFHAVWVSGFK